MRKTAPKGAAQFIASSFARGDYQVSAAIDRKHPLAAALLGDDARQLADQTASATDSRCAVIALGLLLAGYEQATGVHSWRRDDRTTARYLQYLASLGYELSPIERLACGEVAPTDEAQS